MNCVKCCNAHCIKDYYCKIGDCDYCECKEEEE